MLHLIVDASAFSHGTFHKDVDGIVGVVRRSLPNLIQRCIKVADGILHAHGRR